MACSSDQCTCYLTRVGAGAFTQKRYITKYDVKVMPHLNFGRNNGKPAAVTSWGLGDEGGKLRLGRGQLESWGESPPAPPPPNDAPALTLVK